MRNIVFGINVRKSDITGQRDFRVALPAASGVLENDALTLGHLDVAAKFLLILHGGRHWPLVVESANPFLAHVPSLFVLFSHPLETDPV